MTASITVSGLIDEPSRRVDYCGITSKSLDERFHLVEPIEKLGVLLHETEELTSLRRLFFLDLVHGAVLDSLVAPHTEIFGPIQKVGS